MYLYCKTFQFHFLVYFWHKLQWIQLEPKLISWLPIENQSGIRSVWPFNGELPLDLVPSR